MENRSFTANTLRRVRAGAALLDKAMPGWAKKIKPEKLDLSSCNQCVLGQLYRNKSRIDGFSAGSEELGLTNQKGKKCGFDAQLVRDSYYGFSINDEADYARLDKAWLYEIGRRVNGRIRGA